MTRLASDAELQATGAAVGDDAVLAAGVDLDGVARLCRIEPAPDAKRRIRSEILEALESRPRLDRQRRLRMRSKELVSRLPKALEDIRP
jgi:hypothetical protein